VALFEPVTSLRRRADGFFDVVSEPRNGARVERTARFVVLASGAYDVANRLGVPGEDLPHVSHYYRDTHSHYRRQVVIVGGKNSAAEAALEIYRAGGYPTIVHRGAGMGDSIKYWVKPDIENRIKERTVRAMFNTSVVEITPSHVVVNGPGGRAEVPADSVLADDRLPLGSGPTARGRCVNGSGDGGARPRRADVRNHRARPVRDRRVRRRQTERPHLHRERSFPRRGRDC
jgi:thioredoxin reductase (NADPH)